MPIYRPNGHCGDGITVNGIVYYGTPITFSHFGVKVKMDLPPIQLTKHLIDGIRFDDGYYHVGNSFLRLSFHEIGFSHPVYFGCSALGVIFTPFDGALLVTVG